MFFLFSVVILLSRIFFKFAGYVPVRNLQILPVDRPVKQTGHRFGRVMKVSTGSISAMWHVMLFICFSLITRGHGYKICKLNCKCSITTCLIANCIIDVWDSQPSTVNLTLLVSLMSDVVITGLYHLSANLKWSVYNVSVLVLMLHVCVCVFYRSCTLGNCKCQTVLCHAYLALVLLCTVFSTRFRFYCTGFSWA